MALEMAEDRSKKHTRPVLGADRKKFYGRT